MTEKAQRERRRRGEDERTNMHLINLQGVMTNRSEARGGEDSKQVIW